MTTRLDRLTLGAAGLLILCAVASHAHAQGRGTQPVAALTGVPIFEADPKWPVLPADWTWGQVIGIFADSQGHVWTSSRSRISEWDPQGKLLQSWDARGPEGNWSTIHGMFVDHNGFVWTNARESNLTVKFTRTGQVVLVIGKYNETGGSNDTSLMGRPSEIWVDPADNEVFVAANRSAAAYRGAWRRGCTRKGSRFTGRSSHGAAAIQHPARHHGLARWAHLPCGSREQPHPGVPAEW